MKIQSSAGLTNIFRPLFSQKNVGKRGIFSKKFVTIKKRLEDLAKAAEARIMVCRLTYVLLIVPL